MKNALILILIVICSNITGQDNPSSIYIDYNNPSSVLQLKSLRNLKNVRSFHFNHPDNLELFKEHLLKISNLEDVDKIVISNYPFKKLPDEILLIEFVREITILSSPSVNFKTMFRQLSGFPILSKITLGNNNIIYLPKEIKLIENLSDLNITLNSEIDLQTVMEVVKDIPTITKLGLPVNQLSELPNEIGELKSLRELDLTNNNLTDLPQSIGKLDSLEVLKLEKNIIVHPSGTYEKLKKLNIKYLSIDKGLSEDEIRKLKDMYPNATIEEAERDMLYQEKMEQEMQLLKDSIQKEIIKNREEEVVESDSIVVFTKPHNNRKVLSTAYLHFASVFDNIPNENDFDSLLFDERFKDSNYYNVYRRQEGFIFEFIHLKLTKSNNKNQIWFHFVEDEYLHKNHNELEAFNDMVWVVVGNSNHKAFKANYVKDKGYSDFRLHYQPEKKNFVLELKSSRGFEKITVVPRFPNKNNGIEVSQISFAKRNVKYQEMLNKRRYDFNKSLFRERASYTFSMKRLNKKAWSDFSKMYFSEEEKLMEREEWLNYHDQIVANELEALKQSELKLPYVTRALVLSDFKYLKDVSEVKKEVDTQIGLFSFINEKDEKIPITSVIIVNKSLQNFKVYKGSHSIAEFYLFLRTMDEYSIIAFLRNGSVAVTDKIDFTEVSFLQDMENVIPLQTLEEDISTIHTLLKKIK